MRIYILYLLFLVFVSSCNAPFSEKPTLQGLHAPIEIIRDTCGINHIYAENQHDLFFAQGYAAAKDRLFQFEIWRRQATGTVAEILGERELKRDIGTRLFKYRGDMTTEMKHYHEDGVEIITAYADGVNAYIDEIRKTPDQLPIEFNMLDILPQKWTPEVVISRHQGLLGNIKSELQIARCVATLGEEKTKEIHWFHPQDPDISMDPQINQELLFDDIIGLYNAYRKKVTFIPEDIQIAFRTHSQSRSLTHTFPTDSLSIGSNNWVVSGNKMADGNTYMANDPHRTIAVPSLRYMAHLVAPGWNVIGGGEPEIPGISIGHNEHGAWGLTVFRTDGEDLMVYQLNPDDLNQYRFKDSWEPMTVMVESIPVKGQKDVKVELRYTRHGPVTYIDSANFVAYAVRCAWLEPGGSPYLASLRMDQANTWEEFREACNYSHIPGENMIWADTAGNIGWQAVGIAPVRRNFSGLVPVPGDGRYEWDGYLPITQKPNSYNPPSGFIATANQNVTSETYQHWDAIGFSWSDPYRGDRVNEVLSQERKLNMEDMKDLQMDYLSIPARILVPLLLEIGMDNKASEAQLKLKDWDYTLTANSISAAIYVAFEDQLQQLANQRFIPEEGKDLIGNIQLTKIINWCTNPDQRFGKNPIEGRDFFLLQAFEKGIVYLEDHIGPDMEAWQYGQEKFKHVYLEHALGNIVQEDKQSEFNLGPYPRGGNAYTTSSTGSNYQQSKGASFRMIVNTGDWDAAIGTNAPGQSGDPASPFYDNLFGPWAQDQYFPVYFSKEKIESIAAEKVELRPGVIK